MPQLTQGPPRTPGSCPPARRGRHRTTSTPRSRRWDMWGASDSATHPTLDFPGARRRTPAAGSGTAQEAVLDAGRGPPAPYVRAAARETFHMTHSRGPRRATRPHPSVPAMVPRASHAKGAQSCATSQSSLKATTTNWAL